MSNKALLPFVWELYPNHPLLLPTFFDPDSELLKNEEELMEKKIKGRGSYDVRLVKRSELKEPLTVLENTIY